MSPVRSRLGRIARGLKRSLTRRTLLPLLPVVVVVVLSAAACTPEQVNLYFRVTDNATQQAVARGFTPDQAAQVRYCESLNQYDFVKGPYHGAYAFTQGTWDNVAAKWFPWLAGHDPAQTEWYWQDAMAKATWAEAGSAPWVECVGPGTWCAAWSCTAGREPR